MDDATRAAFRAARYRFNSPAGELLLKVDVADPALANLMRVRGAGSAAVLTAFNPQGRRHDDSINRSAQDALQQEIEASGYRILHGENEDPLGNWPVEKSFLIPGMSLAAAKSLAARYNQLAFLWTDAASATPRLIETAAPD